ncbi:MAG TPA: PEP-CTERM sorting domain-containing protein [Gemmatimonadales bacterium]|nr:PEP-CTERM sorting domain-containing protein [Gemmatimonadales bacterium]
MRRLVLAVIALATAALPAAAQTRQVTLNRAWSWGATSGTTYGGVYIGPYGASSPGMPNFDVFCVDFLHAASLNNPWTARFTSLADQSGVETGTRFGRMGVSDVVTKYRRAAWLATQFATNGGWAGIHQAIWYQFTPGSPTWTGTGYETWLAQADVASLNGFNGMDWQNWYVVTDVNTNSSGSYGRQEYLTYVTPEPETLLLLATGLAVVIGYAVVSRRFV